MGLRFYMNQVNQASRSVAGWFFTSGLALFGIGFLIFILRDLFAILFTAIFFAAGIGCVSIAFRIFFAQRKLKKLDKNGTNAYRKNVRIHTEEHNDLYN
jgi:hypothetical protein